MTRSAFYSFHFANDAWRASQVRNMGVIESNKPAKDNEWETIEKGGESAIKRWINDQMHGKSCVIVLIGSRTAERKWIKYEIEYGWKEGKALLGIHIDGLKNQNGEIGNRGENPFSKVNVQINGFWGPTTKPLSEIVKVHSPWAFDSQGIYAAIKNGLSDWIEEAHSIRAQY